MKRRELITLLGGAAVAWPLAARAQQSERVRRIGVLMGVANDQEGQSRVRSLETGLQDLGWWNGRNLQIEYRWAEGDLDRMRAFAKELVGLVPELIVAGNTPVVAALMQQTRTIPIVFVMVSDPVGSGLVTNLARPGGNVTGFANFEFSMGSKWTQLIKEMVPNVVRVGVLFNSATAPYASGYMHSVEAAGSSMSIAVTTLPISDVGGIESAIANLAATPNSALFVLTDVFTTVNREKITTLATKYRLPAVYPHKYFAVGGGLISYGIDIADLHRRSASYVDRILKGANPAELPVQAPTKFELVINLKTAKALGVTVPPTLLTRADEVIE
jgi:putative ABC transport system substrate-binding protein